MCYTPLTAYERRAKKDDGSYHITLNPHLARPGSTRVPIKCGKCLKCRQRTANEKALRMAHEALMQEAEGNPSCFITLTYNPKNIPPVYNDEGDLVGYGDINYRHIQLFIKRLSIRVKRKISRDIKIKYFAAPEYGTRFKRPHYHIVIIGFCPTDLQKLKRKGKYPLYRSPLIESLWYDEDTGDSLGYSSVGSLTMLSALYVSKYAMKRAIGKYEKDEKLLRVNPETGEKFYVSPERSRSSTRLGKTWFEKYKKPDIILYDDDAMTNNVTTTNISKGFITFDGKKFSIPSYYKKLLKESDPASALKLTTEQTERAKLFQLTPAQLNNQMRSFKQELSTHVRQLEDSYV